MSARPSEGLDFEQLNAEQRRGYQLAVEDEQSMFITGEAGTGKSTLIKFIIDGLVANGKNVAVTAYNGIAALNINGTTLCKWSGFGPFDEPLKAYEKRKKPPKTWKDTDVLIIDEISVVSAELFDKIEALARIFRRSAQPFGGMQVIVMGDFFQLPPVPSPGKIADFCFMSNAWKAHIKTHVVLTQVIRQQDADFVQMLREVRMGNPSADTIRALNKRVIKRVTEIPEKHGVRPTIIYSHKASVEAENRAELLKLKGVSCFYVATFSCLPTAEGQSELDAIRRNCQATPRLEFRVGAQVMLVANLSPETGLVNGSRGVVTKLKPGYVKVLFDNGVKSKIEQHSWKKEKWSNRSNTVISTIASYNQIPLILAYAITAHKSQGLTISCAAVDTSQTFANGQAYVCLSRATSLQGLYLLTKFRHHHAKTDPRVIAFYDAIAPRQQVEILLSSSSDDEDDPPLFSPHFGVVVPSCFSGHTKCMQCSFVFCSTCLDNAADYCSSTGVCRRCSDTHIICYQCQNIYCQDCRANAAYYSTDMAMCHDCIAGECAPKRRRCN